MDEDANSGAGTIIEIGRIMEMIPHRPPMLMIDRVVDLVADVSATGIKNVTINEPFFDGHFPGNPVMPGVLIIEAIIQIHERNNPTAVLDILEAYLPEKQRNLREDDPSPGANTGRRATDRPGGSVPMNRQATDRK